jgi:hypothetical protein
MNPALKSLLVDGGVLLSPAVVAASLALTGVLVGLVARDIVMAIYLARKKRADELADKKVADHKAHRDLVRLYSDPLREAVRSLKFRLEEIVEKKQGRYLLSDAPNTTFLTYKRISTLYRIAALLGWVRAIRRERSHLDPDQASASGEMQSIADLEEVLANGTHVEMQRLDELSNLWCVRSIDESAKSHIANLIDAERAHYLAQKGTLGARDLSADEQIELAERCAEIVRQLASVDIPTTLVIATAGQASIIFGIKEAYIYRDWQAAIGDLMLVAEKVGARHFGVIGFGAFEDMFLATEQKKKRTGLARWFDRLKALVHDLDMTHESIFDARRDQLRKIYQCCKNLEAALDERMGIARP